MRRYWYRRVLIMALVMFSILGMGLSVEKEYQKYEQQQVSNDQITNQFVIPGGMPIGVYMETDGVLILGTDYIESADGQKHNPAENIVKSGDYILEINGISVESKKQLVKEISNLQTDDVVLKLRRDNEIIEVKVTPVLNEKKEYKLGIWIKDNIQGLGTITYISSDNQFGALGHGIHDADVKNLLEIDAGKVYKANILNIKKGVKGLPGGMEGMIVYNRANLLGAIESNTEVGVFGTIKDISAITDVQEKIPVCGKNDVKKGEAKIRCNITGEIEEYDIEIVKVNRFSREPNKGMVIKVTDERLINITGGIIQGMSGSPILQDGKIVGAVTHVLVNDPTKGYGVFIENMLNAAA